MNFAIECMIFGFDFQMNIGVNILTITIVINKPHTIVSRGLTVIDSKTITRTSTLIIVKDAFNGGCIVIFRLY